MDTLYPAMITPDEPGFMIQFVDMENVFTCGDTIEECLFNGAEVLMLMLECFLEDGKEIPHPSENVDGAYYIVPDAKVQSALLIKWARGEKSLADTEATR